MQNTLCVSVSFQQYIFIIFSTGKYCSQEVFTMKKERQNAILLEEYVGYSMKKKSAFLGGVYVYVCVECWNVFRF